MQFGNQGYTFYLKIYYLKYNTILKELINRLNKLAVIYLENYLG